MSRDRLVVIGGDAAGLSAAAQARRLRPPEDLEIVVLEQGPEVSYSACGIPYWIGGLVSDRDRLIARTPEQFAEKDIVVRTDTRAEGIDLAAGEVVAAGGERLGYDSLVVATGGRPMRPKVPGLDADGVYGVHRLADGADIRAAIAAGAKRAVVLGGGYIGLEMAEVLQTRGLHVTVVLADPLPMAQLDDDMGEKVCAAMCDMGIDVQTGQPVREIEVDADGVVRAVRTDAGSYPADLVVLGLGMGPHVDLAREAGLQIGRTGAIDVTQTQRSRSHPEVFAAGDCSQTIHRLTGEAIHVALGTHANKQGRVAGSVIGGRPARFAGVLGTAMTKVGDLEVARTGLCTTQAEDGGYDFRTELIESSTRAGYYPGSAPIHVKLISERGSGLLLGAQIVGGPGSGKRIDVFATAIWAGMTAEELSGSDLSYAPPFSPTYDPVVVAARVASRVERGLNGVVDQPGTEIRQADWYGEDLSGQEHTGVAFVDVDLTESTDEGAVFTGCSFRDCRFNVSQHTGAAFLNCTFTGCSFFQASFTDCKFVGSTFLRCTFDLMTVAGGDWSFTGLPGADLSRATLSGTKLREADLTGLRAAGATLRHLDLSAAELHDADLSGADLRGSDLSAVDPRNVDLTGAQVDVTQAVVLVTSLGLRVRPDAPD